MRTLYEIIDGAKAGKKPTHEECYYAMLALEKLTALDVALAWMDGFQFAARSTGLDPDVVAPAGWLEQMCEDVRRRARLIDGEKENG